MYERGEIVNVVLTGANVDDRNKNVIDTLTNKMFGKLYTDKGSLSQSLFGKLFNDGIHIVTGLRSNMKQRLISIYNKLMLRKRSIIESLNDVLKYRNNSYTFTTVAYIIFRWTCFLQWRHIVFSMSSRRLTSTLT